MFSVGSVDGGGGISWFKWKPQVRFVWHVGRETPTFSIEENYNLLKKNVNPSLLKQILWYSEPLEKLPPHLRVQKIGKFPPLAVPRSGGHR